VAVGGGGLKQIKWG